MNRGRESTITGAPVRDHVILQAADSTYAIRMGVWKLVERAGAPGFDHRNKKKADLDS